MADKNVKFTLDLDIKDFTEKGLKAKGIIESLSDKENLSGLVEGLVGTTAVLGTVGLAAFAFKKALDFTVEAEHIRKVEEQFAALSNQAGISGRELKEGLEEASKGLVTTGDLLQVANQAIIKMGSSAQKLPEIMELARKATQVFGGDVKSNFENMTTAIANGNVRMLRQYGILIDSEKAVKDYAKANGLAANELSETGRRQAILNEALAQGQNRFKNVHDDLGNATNTLTLLKNTVAETAEVFTLFFEKTFGPSVKSFLQTVYSMAHQARIAVTGMFGEGLEQNNVQIEQTEKHLKDLEQQMILLQTVGDVGRGGFFNTLFQGSKEDRIKQIQADIAKTTAALEQLRQKNAELKSEEGKRGPAGDSDESIVNKEAQLANEKKFQEQMTAIQREELQQRSLLVQSYRDIEGILKEQELAQAQVHQQKLTEIRSSAQFSEQQKMALIDEENKRYMASQRAREVQLADERRKLLDQYQKNATGAFDGIGRAFQVNATKQRAEMNDFGKRGQQLFNSFQSNAVTAFSAMGAAAVQGANVAETAAKALGATILGTIGDKAIADGSYMMLSGIFPPNPVQIGAGAGLIALGGALKSVSSGMISSMRPSSSGGGGPSSPDDPCPIIAKAKTCASTSGSEIGDLSSSSDQSSSAASSEPDMAQMERKQRSVNVQIAGNYYETESTRRQLMEMIRQESDATDFKYDTIGVG